MKLIFLIMLVTQALCFSVTFKDNEPFCIQMDADKDTEIKIRWKPEKNRIIGKAGRKNIKYKLYAWQAYEGYSMEAALKHEYLVDEEDSESYKKLKKEMFSLKVHSESIEPINLCWVAKGIRKVDNESVYFIIERMNKPKTEKADSIVLLRPMAPECSTKRSKAHPWSHDLVGAQHR